MSLSHPNTPVSQQDLQDFYNKIKPYMGGGTTDYSDLENKPSVNNVTLSGDKTANDLGLQDVMQVSSLPTASVDYVGKIYQYIGVTGNELTHGYYYECRSDGEPTPTYSWVQTDVQPNGGSYTAGDGIDITNDVISTDNLQSGDMNDIISKRPTAHAGREVFVSDVLTAGSTSITLTSDYITTSSIIDPYTDTFGINPMSMTVTTGQVVLTFAEQESDLGVGIGIK